MLPFLDYLFHGIHLGLIFFNLSGWAFKSTRKIHLICIGLVLFSWTVLGFFYGFGYCPLTDWHWEVKRRLGETGLPPSYITLLFEQIFGLKISNRTSDVIIVLSTFSAVILNLILLKKDKGSTS